MSLKKLLSELDDDLHDRSFADRLKEDLNEHADDIRTRALLEGDANEDAVIAHLGSAHEISTMYNQAMRIVSPAFQRFEALILGVLSTPIYAPTILIGTLGIRGLLLTGNDISYFLTVFFALFVLLPAYNTYALRNVVTMRNDHAFRDSLFIALITPIVIGIVCLALVLAAFGLLADENFVSELVQVISGPILALMLTYAQYRGMLWALDAQPKTEQQKIAQRILATFGKYLPIIAGVALFVYFTLTHIAFVAHVNPESIPFSYLLIGPRMVIEALLWIGMLIMSTMFGSFFTLPIATLIASVVIMSSFVLLSIPLFSWAIHRKDAVRFPWPAPAAVSFVMFFFGFAPIEQPNVDWQVPAVHISKKIEQRQLGPFYRIAKYLNQKEGKFSTYFAHAHDGQLRIIQHEGAVFTITLEGELDYRDLIRDQHATPVALGGLGPMPVPEGMMCGNSVLSSETRANDHQTNLLMNGSGHFSVNCGSLTWDGRVLATDIEGFAGMEVSPDGTVAAVLIDGGAYDPDEMFLIDLRE